MASRRQPRGGDPAVIELLEGMLAAAKQGDVRDVLVVWTDPDGDGRWRYAAHDIDNLVFEARVATAEIRTRHPAKRGPKQQ
jgi:hypothetical protein